MDEREKCPYCRNDELRDRLMIKICDLDVSTLYLFREQSHKGRCVVAYKEHVNEQFDIPEQDYLRLMKDIRMTGAALKKAFSPTKINFGAYSDTLKHAHWHIVPKYEGEEEFGGVFAMNPAKVYLAESEYASRIEAIREALKTI